MRARSGAFLLGVRDGLENCSNCHSCFSPRSSLALRASALSFSLNIRMACPARSLKGWVVFVACAGGVKTHPHYSW